VTSLPRNVYPHRGGYRGQRQVGGEFFRTDTLPTPELAAAALEALLSHDGEEPTADVLEQLERAGEHLTAARQAIQRATLAAQRKRGTNRTRRAK